MIFIKLNFVDRRIQDDLAATCQDCNNARRELEIARRCVDDLKTQLQTYVMEVKRTEDLISQKVIFLTYFE